MDEKTFEAVQELVAIAKYALGSGAVKATLDKLVALDRVEAWMDEVEKEIA